jgi:cell division protein FtsB
MSHPNGEGAQGGAEGSQSGAGENTGEVTDANSNAQTAGTSGTEANPELTRAQQELETYRARMQAADQRASRYETELKQLRDKDLPEAEKLQRDFQESQEQVATLQQTNQALALQVAFLKDNTYTWHNPERALKLVDLSQVEIDGSGSVQGLKDALKALATSDPYLVRSDVTESQAGEKETPPPATAPGNNGASANGKSGKAGISRRFPALGTRVQR